MCPHLHVLFSIDHMAINYETNLTLYDNGLKGRFAFLHIKLRKKKVTMNAESEKA